MKTIRYILLTMAAATFVTSCNDELNPNDINKGNSGDEVQFGAALPGGTKTIYGDETATGFPIYWVDGDLVKVASPQCLSGRNYAEYKVSVENEKQNYATALTKTGDYGVQWGSAETADFYSIYPSEACEMVIDGNSVSATLTVDATQFANTVEKASSYYSQPAKMGNVIMYAKTAGVESGKAVNLTYKPFSTVIEFELNLSTTESVPAAGIIVQSITLTAPTDKTIAGKFGFKFGDTPNVTPIEDGGNNSITLHFLDNDQYKITLTKSKPTLKAKMCLIPISGVSNLSDWKVEVTTSAGKFTKTLTEQTGKLIAGLVHKIKLPALSSSGSGYDNSNWIPSLPDYKNIYLTEISLPGAWYAGSSETYQESGHTISGLWDAGVRAFAVECRSYTERTGRLGYGDLTNVKPTGVCLSGTGSEKNGAYTTSGAFPFYSSVKRISSIISSIASAIKTNEYGVLVLSYADGGQGGHRTLDYQNFITGIATEISDAKVSNIYAGVITPETTVNDVLGKLIIKVNIDSNIQNGAYNNGMNALFSYNPFLQQMGNADYTQPYYSNLSWRKWGDTYKSYDLVSNLQGASGNADRFVWVFSSANRTQANNNGDTSIPTYDQRQEALGAMMEYSKQIYDASTHNVWFYFNCGGAEATSQSSTDNSPTAFAEEMNDWLLNTALAGKTDASPLGIVMFNQCTNATYYGPAIIQAIIDMNSRFYLKHAGTSGGNTGGSTSGSEDNTAQNDSSFADGGEMF